MSKEEEKRTLELIEKALSKQPNASRLEINWNMILQTLIIAGILYLTTAFNEGKNNDIIQTQNIQNVQADVTELKVDFKKFSEQPRYTKENATSDLLPIVNKLNQLNSEVTINKDDINELVKSQQELELKIGLLKMQN